MSDTTNILDLPTDPVGGGPSNNIVMRASEPHPAMPPAQPGQPPQQGQLALDQGTISQIVSGLQQATLAGATQLPSRDIPMNTAAITADSQVMPNYVPPPPPQHVDYIQRYEQTADMVSKHQRKQQSLNSLDEMYNEIQTPLLLAVLFFVFQLPFFKRFMYTYLPFLFANDGNYNLNGFLFVSAFFGMLFHFLMKTTTFFGAF